MKKLNSLFLFVATVSILASCNDSTEEPKPEQPKKSTNYSYDDNGDEVEAYIAAIDENDSLLSGSSLDYTRSDGYSMNVEFVVDDSSEIVRLVESFTTSNSGSIQSKVFYYKEGLKYATKEYFEVGTGDAAKFVERVSYYDEKEQPVVTKQRTAPFEDMLEQKVFNIIEKYDCKDDKAFRALNQKGEFETNFKGFIAEGPLNYMIVGENRPDGYVSSLLVQYYTPLVDYLIDNEKKMMDQKLEVDFEKVREGTGFTFQSLLRVRLGKKDTEEKETNKEEKKAS